jgi:hypothetical protein
MNVRTLAIAPVSLVAGYAAFRVGEWLLPHAVIRGGLGVSVIAAMVVFLVRGARACARGELTFNPGSERSPAPEGDPNARVHTRIHADAQARAREAA